MTTDPIPTERLHWDAKTRTFTAEASELGPLGRLVLLRSARTGAVEEFTWCHTEKDRECDVTYWEYESHRTGCRLRVYND